MSCQLRHVKPRYSCCSYKEVSASHCGFLVGSCLPVVGISGGVYAADAAGMLPLVVSHGDAVVDTDV